MNSIERASQLMKAKPYEIPPMASAYAGYLAGEYGCCGEVFVTAYAQYAEIAEAMQPTPGYEADDKTKAFFAGYYYGTEAWDGGK